MRLRARGDHQGPLARSAAPTPPTAPSPTPIPARTDVGPRGVEHTGHRARAGSAEGVAEMQRDEPSKKLEVLRRAAAESRCSAARTRARCPPRSPRRRGSASPRPRPAGRAGRRTRARRAPRRPPGPRGPARATRRRVGDQSASGASDAFGFRRPPRPGGRGVGRGVTLPGSAPESTAESVEESETAASSGGSCGPLTEQTLTPASGEPPSGGAANEAPGTQTPAWDWTSSMIATFQGAARGCDADVAVARPAVGVAVALRQAEGAARARGRVVVVVGAPGDVRVDLDAGGRVLAHVRRAVELGAVAVRVRGVTDEGAARPAVGVELASGRRPSGLHPAPHSAQRTSANTAAARAALWVKAMPKDIPYNPYKRQEERRGRAGGGWGRGPNQQTWEDARRP